jgi:hypothetical protein
MHVKWTLCWQDPHRRPVEVATVFFIASGPVAMFREPSPFLVNDPLRVMMLARAFLSLLRLQNVRDEATLEGLLAEHPEFTLTKSESL